MKLQNKLYLYKFLSRISWLRKSYTAKIMLVAFIGTHVPLLVLLVWFVVIHSYSWGTTLQILLIALLATLVGTGLTLYALSHLLTPVIFTSTTLKNYLNHQILPDLPTNFADEAGTLMAGTSQALHQLDELIHYIKNYDPLTGLPNRYLFRDRLLQKANQSQHHQYPVGVLLLDIDDFISISHTLDHETTNLLLRKIAQRLTTCIKSTDILAHLTRSEFAIARTEINSFENLISLSQLLRNLLAKPFAIEDQKIYLTVSIGITINHVNQENSVEEILQQAHIALYYAKQQGRGQYEFYSSEINTQLQERLVLENDLYGALERGEMLVHYQPMVDLCSRKIKAMEALVRWQHPTKGLISPAKFIPLAEANALIIPIGEWVLRTACAQNRAWQMAGFSPLRVSVNLSAQQFNQPNLVKVIKQILQETQLEPSYLELEVTESFLIADIKRSVKTLEQLRELGISLALDDFGTGYSSLHYLKRLPVSILKIDRSFVQDLTSDPDSATITDAIIALAKSLKLNITAEGIETEEQLNYLVKQGCDEGQGYYFSKPMPAEAIAQVLSQEGREQLSASE
jgi:diguanylate cyclase (GGDEF)-like protein